MFSLRDYQSEALAAVQQQWADGINRPVVVLPTGAGKTVCFAGLIERSMRGLKAEGKRVLVLAHREELLEQAEAKIKAMVPGVATAIVKGSRGATKHRFADVIVASVQTLARPARRAAVDRIGMVIVDECHRYASRTYREVLAYYGCMDERATPTVGFTATLTRMDGGLPDVWQSVAYQKKIHWMIKNRYLVAPVAKSIEVPGLSLASTRITAGDLNSGDVADALENSKAYEAIAEQWAEHASERPTIVFMPNVETSEHMAEAFARVAGTTAEVITGATVSGERKAAYDRFASGTTRVLVSCMVLTEGFDAPQTSCVIIGRPTLNPGLYIQMVGRGLRLHPGKSDCLVLDLAGASLTHNLAGVNDLESDCEGNCDCNCLTCGCSDRCKCGIRQCGCACIEQHSGGAGGCRCMDTEECGCGCVGECACDQNPECPCRGGGERPVEKEVGVEVLRTLVEIDILGTQAEASSYNWLTTHAGIRFLTIGSDTNLFALPAPGGAGYFIGKLNGYSRLAHVERLDNGAMSAEDAFRAIERLADDAGYSYNSRKSSWRRTPASEAQVKLLRGLGVTVPDGCRKGQAGDMISTAKVSKVLDPRFGKYVAG
jgi:superfamily II DNA or RNA helicase